MAKEEKNETLDQIQYHYDKIVENVDDLVDEADKEQEDFENRENYDSDKGIPDFCDSLLDELDQIQGELEDLELVIPPKDRAANVAKQAEPKIKETLEANEQLKEKAKAIESRPVDDQDAVPEVESRTPEQISEPEAPEEQVTEEAETKVEEEAVEPEAEVEEPQAVEESEKPEAETAADSQPSEAAADETKVVDSAGQEDQVPEEPADHAPEPAVKEASVLKAPAVNSAVAPSAGKVAISSPTAEPIQMRGLGPFL